MDMRLRNLADFCRGLSRRQRAFALFITGAVATLALAPFGLMPAMFVVMPCFVWLMDGALIDKSIALRLRSGFYSGWWFGFGYFVAGLWWLGVAVMKDAAHFAWALPFAVFGLPAILAIFYGLAGGFAALFWRFGVVFRLIALGFAIAVAEWSRGHVASGFPWNAIAYTAVPTPIFMQSVRITGIYVLSGLAVYVFSAPVLLVEAKGRVVGLALAGLLFAGDLGYGYYTLSRATEPQGQTVTFRLVQPAFKDDEWNSKAGRDQIFATLLEMTARALENGDSRPDIIVWPESSLPFLLDERPDARTAIGEVLSPGQMLILGGAKFAGRNAAGLGQFYNAIYALNDQGEVVAVSAKMHLVPFGEYMPFEGLLQSIGLHKLTTFAGRYVPSPDRRMLTLPGGLTLYPLICYEAIFPRLVGPGVDGAAALINITYDAWFGRTTGPFQHFAQSRLRAVSADKPLVRVGENGVSAVVDANGRILKRMPFDQPGILDVKITLP